MEPVIVRKRNMINEKDLVFTFPNIRIEHNVDLNSTGNVVAIIDGHSIDCKQVS